MRILVVDDHAIFRSGVRTHLCEGIANAVVDEASNAVESMARLRSAAYAVVVLDIALQGESGFDLLGRIKQEAPKLPVLMLSIHTNEEYAVRALQAGAAGYLTKLCAPEELLVAVREVLRGNRYVSASLAEPLAAALANRDGRPLHARLSNREYQVLRMIGAGKTVSQIGEALHLSPKTVSTHRTHILAKMGKQTNSELILYVVQNGLGA